MAESVQTFSDEKVSSAVFFTPVVSKIHSKKLVTLVYAVGVASNAQPFSDPKLVIP